MEADPAIDRKDPSLRYLLVTVSNDGLTRKAFIRDLLVGVSRLIRVGETIGDCELTDIAADGMSVRLKTKDGLEFIFERTKPGRAARPAETPNGDDAGKRGEPMKSARELEGSFPLAAIRSYRRIIAGAPANSPEAKEAADRIKALEKAGWRP